jgi:hypothetical protein
MKTATLIPIMSCAAAVAASAALAAVKDPKPLLLRASDFPAGAVAGPSFAVANGTYGAKDAYVVVNYRDAGAERVATSEVAVSKSSGAAATGFKRMVAAHTGTPGSAAVKLSAYGDEQRAEFVSTAALARGTLIVRQGAVVWRLAIESCGPYSPSGCLHGRTPPKLTLAQALAELKRYAAKQKARVGS